MKYFHTSIRPLSFYKAFPSLFPMGRLEYLIKDWKSIYCELSGQLQKNARQTGYNSYLWFPLVKMVQ